MPYADPEKRREFDRERKRRQRAEAGVSTPDEIHVMRVYLCLQVPQLRLSGGVIFKNGLFVTGDVSQKAIIEADPGYGQHIFSWRLEP